MLRSLLTVSALATVVLSAPVARATTIDVPTLSGPEITGAGNLSSIPGAGIFFDNAGYAPGVSSDPALAGVALDGIFINAFFGPLAGDMIVASGGGGTVQLGSVDLLDFGHDFADAGNNDTLELLFGTLEGPAVPGLGGDGRVLVRITGEFGDSVDVLDTAFLSADAKLSILPVGVAAQIPLPAPALLLAGALAALAAAGRRKAG